MGFLVRSSLESASRLCLRALEYSEETERHMAAKMAVLVMCLEEIAGGRGVAAKKAQKALQEIGRWIV